MNFGRAFTQLVDCARGIRRASWRDDLTLTIDLSRQLTWLDSVDGKLMAEHVSCIPASDLMADDWEVVS